MLQSSMSLTPQRERDINNINVLGSAKAMSSLPTYVKLVNKTSPSRSRPQIQPLKRAKLKKQEHNLAHPWDRTQDQPKKESPYILL